MSSRAASGSDHGLAGARIGVSAKHHRRVTADHSDQILEGGQAFRRFGWWIFQALLPARRRFGFGDVSPL